MATLIRALRGREELEAADGKRADQETKSAGVGLRICHGGTIAGDEDPAAPVEFYLKEGDNLSGHSVAPSIAADAFGDVCPIRAREDHEIDDGLELADELVEPNAPLRGVEDTLVERSLAADHEAFELLVRRYSPRVFAIVGSFFRRRDQIEDIAQEVFAKAYFSLATFTRGRSFEAWIARIAVNACYDHLRAQRRRGEQQTPHESQEEDGWLELQMLEAARARHLSSERQRDAAEIADRLLSKLEPEDRLVVVLIDRDGYSVKEVSELTGWGQSKVKVRAFRARRTLRAAMKRLIISGERMQRGKQ